MSFPRNSLLIAAGLSLLLTTTVSAQPKDGQTFDNWAVRCEKLPESEVEQCYLFQNLVLKEGGQRVLHMAVGYIPDNPNPVAIMTLPLGISLPPGVSVQIDNDEPVVIPVERCEQKGCQAGLVLEEKLLNAFKRGIEAKVIIHDGARRPINVPVSLKGFTAGLNSLR